MRRVVLLSSLVLALSACAGPLPAEFAPAAPAAGHHGQVPVGSVAAPDPATGDFNLADVMYLQMAIANHEQGIDLVALAGGGRVSPQVGELAAAIGATQKSEIEQMRAWLTGWDKPTAVSDDPAAHAHHGGMPLTSPETIAELAALPDGEFERSFVTVLTGHQHNAVEMAQQEITDGVSPVVTAFADRVVQSRTGQISALLKISAG